MASTVSVALARSLRDAGLSWSPRAGDTFIVADRGMDDEVFVLSNMTVDVHHFPTGPVIGFNGTTEWALDSLDQSDALWLPAEHQLRDLLGDAFVSLERSDGTYVVVARSEGRTTTARAAVAADAYALTLLDQLTAPRP